MLRTAESNIKKDGFKSILSGPRSEKEKEKVKSKGNGKTKTQKEKCIEDSFNPFIMNEINKEFITVTWHVENCWK